MQRTDRLLALLMALALCLGAAWPALAEDAASPLDDYAMLNGMMGSLTSRISISGTAVIHRDELNELLNTTGIAGDVRWPDYGDFDPERATLTIQRMLPDLDAAIAAFGEPRIVEGSDRSLYWHPVPRDVFDDFDGFTVQFVEAGTNRAFMLRVSRGWTDKFTPVERSGLMGEHTHTSQNGFALASGRGETVNGTEWQMLAVPQEDLVKLSGAADARGVLVYRLSSLDLSVAELTQIVETM